MAHPNINQHFFKPPFSVERVPVGFYVANKDGLNVLQFPAGPQKFACEELCRRIADEANGEVV